MIRVLIITQNEPFFIPKMLDQILSSGEGNYEVQTVTLLNPHRKNKSYYHWFRERSGIYNYRELFISAAAYIYCRIHTLILKKSYYSVRGILLKNNIRLVRVNDINSEEYLNRVKELSPDVIVSISCPQIFGEKLIKSTQWCINAHGTLLPRHRGVFGSWWTLFNGDKWGGSTIHTMEEKLDAGIILWQKKFAVDNDTQYSIAYKTKRDMSEGLVEVLNRIDFGNMAAIISDNESSYHRAPTKEQGSQFHKKGLKVIALRDIKLMLKRQFK